MSAILDIQDLHTHFFTKTGVVKAVNGVNLTLEEGKVTGLVGESGCGKSVTALSILRLVPYPGRVVQGQVRYRGQDLLTMKEEELRKIREELPLTVLVHTGLVDRELALALKTAAIDGAMIDIIGADETIRGVYHLQATVAEYEESLASLTQAGVPTMPHIVLGLDHGRLVGEEVALDMAARYPISALVVVVLTPLAGTPMDGVAPPGEREIGGFLEKARALLPRTPLVLGCARPAGARKAALDRWAIRAGVNGIAYPAEGTVRYARRMGLEPHFYETCCALVPREAVVSS